MRCRCHLAHINIARARGTIDEPVMAGFVSRLDEINLLAERSRGFVWRLQTEAGDATAVRVYEDPRILVNLSVWESLEHLKDYAFRGAHADVMKQRREWFERLDYAYAAMWWIPAGHLPTVAEAKERLHYLQKHGPSDFAFSFAKPFPAPGMQLSLTQQES